MTELDDVDPANGTEPHREELDDGRSAPEALGAPVVELFTAPEKLVNVARAVTARPSGDPKVAALLGVLTSGLGKRLVLNPALALLPPLDAPAEWDEWLGLLVGCALELVSDGVSVDVDVCRVNARGLLVAVFEGAA